MNPNNIELLAPAGSYEGFEAALGAGADAEAGIAAIVPVATHKEDTPARVVVGVEIKPSAHGADSPGDNYTSGLPRIRKNGRK